VIKRTLRRRTGQRGPGRARFRLGFQPSGRWLLASAIVLCWSGAQLSWSQVESPPASPSEGDADPAAEVVEGEAPASSRSLAAVVARIEPVSEQRLRRSIEGALRFLAETQLTEGPDAGSWPSGRYSTAVTSIAGLSFLAHGHGPDDPRYGPVVRRAMDYVEKSMTPDGYLGSRGDTMYVHALCTLFGLAYLGQSGDPTEEAELARWCERAVGGILEAQDAPKRPGAEGGWRYEPYSPDSDLSVTSWNLLVLHSARQAGYRINPEVFDRGLEYVNRSFREVTEDRGGFLYRIGGASTEPEPGVTGAAIGVKTLLESQRDQRTVDAFRFLTDVGPTWGGEAYKGYFYFVSFYMAQGYFQLGGEPWAAYRTAIQRILVDHQRGNGSWPLPGDNLLLRGERWDGYATAMALLILGIENQYLPVYQRQAELFRY